jgi:hypothetical protein
MLYGKILVGPEVVGRNPIGYDRFWTKNLIGHFLEISGLKFLEREVKKIILEVFWKFPVHFRSEPGVKFPIGI